MDADADTPEILASDVTTDLFFCGDPTEPSSTTTEGTSMTGLAASTTFFVSSSSPLDSSNSGSSISLRFSFLVSMATGSRYPFLKGGSATGATGFFTASSGGASLGGARPLLGTGRMGGGGTTAFSGLIAGGNGWLEGMPGGMTMGATGRGRRGSGVFKSSAELSIATLLFAESLLSDGG